MEPAPDGWQFEKCTPGPGQALVIGVNPARAQRMLIVPEPGGLVIKLSGTGFKGCEPIVERDAYDRLTVTFPDAGPGTATGASSNVNATS